MGGGAPSLLTNQRPRLSSFESEFPRAPTTISDNPSVLASDFFLAKVVSRVYRRSRIRLPVLNWICPVACQ